MRPRELENSDRLRTPSVLTSRWRKISEASSTLERAPSPQRSHSAAASSSLRNVLCF